MNKLTKEDRIMNTEIKTTVYFSVGGKEYEAEQQFPTATWHINEACYEPATPPNSGSHKSYRYLTQITCKSRSKEKIKAAFLALDECTDD